MAIKKANVQHKWDIPGPTIYNAVLTGQVKTVQEFKCQFVEQLSDVAS